MRVLLSAVVGLTAAFASAAATASTVLEPTSPWDLDYANSNCRLIQMFGSGRKAIRLVFEQVAPHSPMTVMVVGDVEARSDDGNVLSFESLPGVQLGGGQAFDAADSTAKILYWARRLGRGRWGLISDADYLRMRKADAVEAERSPSAPASTNPSQVSWKDRDWHVQPLEKLNAEDAAFSERADRVTAVVINPGSSRSISLHTGSLAKPLEALEKCTVDSLKDWGIDPAVDASIVTSAHPVEDPLRQFSPNDYPVAALRASKEDNLEVWLNISAQGAITNCRVISDFASQEINDAMCGMVRRERFVPARTKDGTAVPDFYTQNFIFKIQ